jgi:transposase-like protein/IS1 family transposase
MLCPDCDSQTRRFGRNRNGSQRYRCDVCEFTFTDEVTRPVDRRFVEEPRMTLCLTMLLEGSSVRSMERVTHTHRDTILAALVTAGENCERFHARTVHAIPVEDVQVDEIWSFVICKEKTRERRNYGQDHGDCYTFTGIERTTKLLLAWHVGKRCTEDARTFCGKLNHAVSGRFQLTTDGYGAYLTAVPGSFPGGVDYATLVKVYGTPTEEDRRRYSPGQVIDVIPTAQIGNPDPARICTSHVERSNLTIRMGTRRFTRLTNAFSKKWANHEAALALFFCFYNFARPHQTLTEFMGYKCTPAMRAGLTDHVWTVPELLQIAGSDRINGIGTAG